MKKILAMTKLRCGQGQAQKLGRLLCIGAAMLFMLAPLATLNAEQGANKLARVAALVEEKKFDEARKILELLLEKNPDDPTVHTMAGLLDEKEEQATGIPPAVARQPTVEPDWQGVLDTLLTHLERPDVQPVWEGAGGAEKLKEFRHAISVLRKEEREARREIAVAQELLKELPEKAPVEVTVAPYELLRGGQEDLKTVGTQILALRQAIEEATGQPVALTDSPKTGPAHPVVDFQQINQLVKEGNYPEAVRLLEQAAAGAEAGEKQKIEKMLVSLSGYLLGRREAVGSRASSNKPHRDTPYAITQLTGGQGDWTALVAKRSLYTEQVASGFCEEWPEAWIGQQTEAGYRITALSGDKHGWCVVMSKCKDKRQVVQIILGPAPFDQKMEARLLRLFNQGYRITTVGGFMNDWVLVLEPNTGFGLQTLLKPDFYRAEEVRRWWKSHEALGYTLTSGNGRFHPTPSGDGNLAFYLLVATSGLESNQQTLEIEAPLPSDTSANADPPLHLIAGGFDGRYLLVRDGVPFAGAEVQIIRAPTFDEILTKIGHLTTLTNAE